MILLVLLLPLGSVVTAFQCNFDTSSSICGFVQNSQDDFDWTRNKGRTPSYSTGPSADHTTGNGYYMYIETSSPRKDGDMAYLRSPKLQFSGKMCLKFYYHMYGGDIDTLYVLINGDIVFSRCKEKGNKWLLAAIDVSLSGKYAVTFGGKRGSGYQGDIAIDDFALEQGSCPLTTGCNFDSSTCGFVQDRQDDFDWTRNKGRTPSVRTGPSADHTTGNGYYMYIETSRPRKYGDNAKLHSPKLLFKGDMCLKFYYHMYGSNIKTLNVFINGNNVFTASGEKGNKWLLAAIDVNFSGEYAVTFEGIRGSDWQGDIAIDDFLLEPGFCPTTFGCNFDTSMCGFDQDKKDDFDWTRRKGRTPSVRTGPSADHTTGNGYYMYIETSRPRQNGDNAKLHSPKLLFIGDMCLKFYYHMYGSDIRTLNVIINGSNVFTASGERGNKWLMAAIDVNFSGEYAVTFEGIRGSDWQGDIAIDDFLLEPGLCPSTFDCNFDTSMCRFVQDKNDDFDWTRLKGSTPSIKTGPPADHTTGNGYHMYIETSLPRRNGDIAKLRSPKLRFNGNMCLKFYYHMYGSNIRTLNLIINGNNVFTASGAKGNKWLLAALDVNFSGEYAVTFEGIRGSSWQGDIAIDDFELEPGFCPSNSSCGIRANTRIVGGVSASHGDWPWQVQLRRSASGSPYCGGSLVSDQWVVTAAHCVEGTLPGSILVRLGAHKTAGLVGTEQDIKVSKVITHPDYRNPLCSSNDVALLKLAKPAQLNRNVNLVCLPRSMPEPSDGTNCWITGWGLLSSGGNRPNYLQQVQVPAVSRARCDRAYPGRIDDSMICAGLDQGGIDTCQGDSGGPMVCETGGKFYLHGVTSWGDSCASPGKFGVYAKVKYLLSWIVGEMSQN